MNAQNLSDLRETYLLAFDNFATTVSEVAEALNKDGHLGSPDQAKRATARLLKNLMERGLVVQDDTNDEAQGRFRRGAFKELVWQCYQTYDSIEREEAEELFNKAFAAEIERISLLPLREPGPREPGEIDAKRLRVGDIIKIPGAKTARVKVYSVQVSSDTVAIGYHALMKDDRERPNDLITFHPIGKPITLITPTPNTKEPTVATVTKKKSGAKKAGTKTTAKPAAAKAKTNGGEKTRRTAEDVAKLVPTFLKHLKAGGTMRQLKLDQGFSDDGPIRAALYRAGYDSKGNKHGVEADSIDASKAAGKKAVAKLRQEGAAWYALAYMTGLTESEIKTIVAEAGVDTSGRVYNRTEKPAKEPTAKKVADTKKTTGAKKAPAKKGTSRKAVAADPS